ncbi:MAG: ATP-binding protein, partial [Panacibacter sp.]
MFIQFTVSNFLSIKDTITLNMVAISTIKENREDNIIHTDKYDLLKSAAIYGANASGKSKLLNAILFFKSFIRNSAKDLNADDKINVAPFRLNPNNLKQPSSFEISFLIGDIKYRYGFELDIHKVHTEWLFVTTKSKEITLFIREGQKIELHKDFKEGKGIEDKTRPNALFISVVAQFNGEISKTILKWFTSFNVISGMEDESYEGFTAGILRDAKKRKEVMKFVTGADLGIKEIKVNEYDITEEKLPKNMSKEEKQKLLEQSKDKQAYELYTLHNKFDNEGKALGAESFDFDDDESEGTKKYFRMAGPILDTLERGGVLFIDELDARLHPILTKFIVRLFNS